MIYYFTSLFHSQHIHNGITGPGNRHSCLYIFVLSHYLCTFTEKIKRLNASESYVSAQWYFILIQIQAERKYHMAYRKIAHKNSSDRKLPMWPC